jgi:hypothetical protein
MRSTTAAKPATTPIPVQLSEPEFTAFILLASLDAQAWTAMYKLGPHRFFHLILWVLYTGRQWKRVLHIALHTLREQGEQTFAWEDNSSGCCCVLNASRSGTMA